MLRVKIVFFLRGRKKSSQNISEKRVWDGATCVSDCPSHLMQQRLCRSPQYLHTPPTNPECAALEVKSMTLKVSRCQPPCSVLLQQPSCHHKRCNNVEHDICKAGFEPEMVV